MVQIVLIVLVTIRLALFALKSAILQNVVDLGLITCHTDLSFDGVASQDPTMGSRTDRLETLLTAIDINFLTTNILIHVLTLLFLIN